MFEKLGNKNKTYVELVQELMNTLGSAVPAELLEKFGKDATALGKIDFAARALKVGDTAPQFTLPDATGKEVHFANILKKGPAVVAFYRGEWCPYCNLHLHQLQQYLPEIKELGATLVAISPQTPDHSLSFKEKNELEFDVLSDLGNKVAKQFGLTFVLDPEIRPVYLLVGSDLSNFNGDDSWELPTAGTYIVGQDGIIEFAFVDGNYTKRLEPSVLVEELRSLQNKKGSSMAV